MENILDVGLVTHRKNSKKNDYLLKKILFFSILLWVSFYIVSDSFGPGLVFEWKHIRPFRPFIPLDFQLFY